MEKALLIAVLLVSVLAIPVHAAQPGNIAVASDEKTQAAPVADRMGRSRYYLIYDGRGTFVKAVDNPNFGKGPRAGGVSAINSIGFDEKGVMTGGIPTPSREQRDKTWTGFSDFFSRNGITVVVAEVFGDEIARGMKARGIECVAFKGSAKEAAAQIAEGSPRP